MTEDPVIDIQPSDSTALKVNNNMLTDWDDFNSIIHMLFVNPSQTLFWIDMSFNDLRTIDSVSHTI